MQAISNQSTRRSVPPDPAPAAMARAQIAELLPQDQHRAQAERQPGGPADKRVEPDGAFEYAGDLAVRSAQQVHDLHRVGIGPPNADRAASHTAAPLVAPSNTIRTAASHLSDSIAANTGASQLDWASIRAAGAMSISRPRSRLRVRSLAASFNRTSIRAGIGIAPSSIPTPNHGSSNAVSSGSGTRRVVATAG